MNHGLAYLVQSDRIKFVAKIVVGLTLILLVLLKVDISSLANVLVSVQIVELALALSLFSVSRFFEGVRLHVLVFRSGFKFWKSVETVFVSTFFNNFTVTIVGDGYKASSIKQAVDTWETALVIVVLERLMGVATVLVLGATIIAGHWNSMVSDGLFGTQFDGFDIRMGGGLLLLGITAITLVATRGNVRRQISARLERFRASRVRVAPWQYVVALVLTALAQLSLASMVFVLVVAFGANLSFSENLLVMLLVYVAAYLPISVGSLGVREGTIVLGLGWFGVAAPTALAAALLSRALIYILAIATGIWWAVRR